MPSQKPDSATLWVANTLSHTQRDFRLNNCTNGISPSVCFLHPQIPCLLILFPQCLQPIFWLPTKLSPKADGSYSASINAPAHGTSGLILLLLVLTSYALGWTGFMIELNYKSKYNPSYVTFPITSQVNIVPDRYPAPSWAPKNPPPSRSFNRLNRH